MPEAPAARRTTVEFPLALLRWLFFAALFGLVYLHSPESRESSRFSSLFILAIAYNLVVTALALAKIFIKVVPAFTVAMDLLFIAALVSISGRNESPLLLFMLVPVVSAALRFHGRGALITALAVALLWMYMLWRAPQPPTLTYVLPVATRLLLLLSLALLSAILSYSEKAHARERERSANEQIRIASEQVKAIYELTGNLSATLNYERVIESILDIGMLGLHDIGEQSGNPAGAVFLFKDTNGERQLYIAAYRNLSEEECKMTFPADGGALAHALSAVEPAVIGKPGDDEELGGLVSWHRYQAAVVLPLRAGFELFGATVFCSERRNAYRDQQLAFLGTLCNQATIALQNAQLYKQVREEKDRILSGEEDVRHWLARELHDGPTQTISALAMRLNYTRLLLDKDPTRVAEELAELEKMARRATKEIRTTLFKLRPPRLGIAGAARRAGAICHAPEREWRHATDAGRRAADGASGTDGRGHDFLHHRRGREQCAEIRRGAADHGAHRPLWRDAGGDGAR